MKDVKKAAKRMLAHVGLYAPSEGFIRPLEWLGWQRRYPSAYFERGRNGWRRRNKGVGAPNPMHGSEMDFRAPYAVAYALVRRSRRRAYGYEGDVAWGAVSDYFRTQHGLESEGILFSVPNVKAGLSAAIRAATAPGDSVIIMPPVYGMFRTLLELNGRIPCPCALQRDAAGRYSIDEASIEAACASGARALLLCSPHNPVGRVWSREELERLAAICRAWHVAVIVDETYLDLVLPPHQGTSFLCLGSLCPPQTVSLWSPGKAFLMASLHAGYGFCRDDGLRMRIERELQAAGAKLDDVLSTTAVRAACSGGQRWLEALRRYLSEGIAIFREGMAQQLPAAVVSPTEGGYYAWVDFSAYGLTVQALQTLLAEEGLQVADGTCFDGEGCCVRMNLACPHRRIREAIAQASTALNRKAGRK